jgi:hypothetical protein
LIYERTIATTTLNDRLEGDATVRELVQALIYRLHSLANDKKWTREALVLEPAR